MAATATRTAADATEAQIRFIVSLATERGAHYDADAQVLISGDGKGVIDLKALTKAEASNAITFFQSIPRPAKPARTSTVQVEDEGMYQVGEDIYKVVRSQYGRLYALQLVLTTNERGEFVKGKSKGKFVIAKGAIFKIRPEHRMTLETATEYGKKFAICCCCGRLLYNKKSVALGIGPVCRGDI